MQAVALQEGQDEQPTASPPLRSPLKWAGGKRWLVPELISLYAQHRSRRLVEPLCGGLAVTFGLRPQSALLNDINPHSINFFRWLQRGFTLEIPIKNSRAQFRAHRARFNELTSSGEGESLEAASLFYYLNRAGYNGLCRFNSKGQFNVPFGRYKKLSYRRTFEEYPKALQNWHFTQGDFEQVQLDSDDFVYADPPYDVPFRQYSAEGFKWENQERLAEWLSRHSGPVVLSNQATSRIRHLYRKCGFKLFTRSAPRAISCTGKRARATEILAVRNI